MLRDYYLCVLIPLGAYCRVDGIKIIEARKGSGMTEKWKPIEGFEGLYSVSNMGRVRSEDREVRNRYGPYTKRGAVLSASSISGSAFISLSREGRQKGFTVAPLVAKAFMPGYVPGANVQHFDGDGMNNQVSNLYQGSRSGSPQMLHGSSGKAREDYAASCRALGIPAREYERFYQYCLHTYPHMSRY